MSDHSIILSPGRFLLQPVWHGLNPCLCHSNSRTQNAKSRRHVSLSSSHLKNSIINEAEPSLTHLNSALEMATKWDPKQSNSLDNLLMLDHIRVLADQRLISISVIYSLLAELKQSYSRIHEFKAERRLSRQNLERFLRKLAEEKTSRGSEKRESMHSMIRSLKDELKNERKNCQRLEVVNSKLVAELAEAKLSANQFLQDYEKEKKNREIIEEVCDELTREIQEGKAEVEDLRSESMRIHEEVEQERKMLELAEVWREERVQMKLIDAKLTLEEKYSQLRKLVVDFEAFLRAKKTNASVVRDREVELLRQAADSVKVEDIKFFYRSSSAKSIYSIYEDIMSYRRNETKIEAFNGDGATGLALEIPAFHSKQNGFAEREVQSHISRDTDWNRDGENGSSRVDTNKYDTKEGRDQSIERRLCEGSSVTRNGTVWEDNSDDDMVNIEIGEVFAAPCSYSKTKQEYICYSENCQSVLVETTAGRMSPQVASSDGMFSEDLCLRGSVYPDLFHSAMTEPTQRMEGRIFCPLGIKKSSLMAKLLEERLESQNSSMHLPQ